MAIQGVIFDLDGTLLDTLEDLADAANATLAHCGFPAHATDSYRYFVGDGLATLIERIIPEAHRTLDQVKACKERFETFYTRNWDLKSRPYPGILEMLQALRQAGLQLAILSNKPHAFTQICVQRFFVPGTFDFIFGQREAVPRKPDPAGALEIAGMMNLAPSQILYVGDTATDMQTGTRAGMCTLGVLWGFRERWELLENKAGALVSHPREIVKYAHE